MKKHPKRYQRSFMLFLFLCWLFLGVLSLLDISFFNWWHFPSIIWHHRFVFFFWISFYGSDDLVQVCDHFRRPLAGVFDVRMLISSLAVVPRALSISWCYWFVFSKGFYFSHLSGTNGNWFRFVISSGGISLVFLTFGWPFLHSIVFPKHCPSFGAIGL